jgi:hypothetical protein
MKKVLSSLVVLIMSMFMVSACAPQSPAVSPAGSTPAGEIIVTLEDQGKTINLSVGENFLLKLGDEYAWQVDISDQAILSRVKNIMVVKGAQGVYAALQAGTVTLSAAGDPQCLQSQPPCAMPSIQFNITVIVK